MLLHGESSDLKHLWCCPKFFWKRHSVYSKIPPGVQCVRTTFGGDCYTFYSFKVFGILKPFSQKGFKWVWATPTTLTPTALTLQPLKCFLDLIEAVAVAIECGGDTVAILAAFGETAVLLPKKGGGMVGEVDAVEQLG